MIVYGTKSDRYISWRKSVVKGVHNGAYYYAKEIEDLILPKIKGNILIVTAGGTLYKSNDIPDGSVIVCHDNQNPKNAYSKMFKKDILWICSKESTVKKLKKYGEKAVYVPLSIDTEYVKKFKRKKTKDIAYVGNAWAFKREYLNSLPDDIEQLSGMPRESLLKEMAKYKRVIAEGRCFMEAEVLGAKCEIPKYDNPKIGAITRTVLDSRDAVKYWREVLEPIAKEQSQSCIIRVRREFNDLAEHKTRRNGEVFRVSKKRAKELLNNEIEIVEEL